MELKEALKLAIQSLWANKLRTVLTLLGVVIGIEKFSFQTLIGLTLVIIGLIVLLVKPS